ncbi:MAG: AAA family ATPase [Anaerolineae bacterium]|nr:AAA family ATPase [Anaerolineae bacterium]
MMRLTKQQMAVAQTALDTTHFVEGMAGTGKTTAGARRLRYLLEEKVPASSILVMVPQKALALPYQAEIRNKKRKAGGQPTIHTIGSLSLHMVDLFWPLVAEQVGFADPYRRPTFLSLELVQYYMAREIGPVIEANDYFNSVRIDRNRLYSQLVDNLNKAAVVGFSHTVIGEKLKAASIGDVEQRYIYEHAQDVVNRFRDFCRQHNLLDFSYQIELFVKHLWRMDEPRYYLMEQFRHLIVDNVEEDNPATHGVLRDWLGECDSAVVIYDSDAGYRRFLGSDAKSAYTLKAACTLHTEIDKTYVMSADISQLDTEIKAIVDSAPPAKSRKASARDAVVFTDNRYYTDMINWTAENIASLIHDGGASAGEIVVLAPLLSDALRFSLISRLESMNVPARSHRPSRALREEPAARTLLTLAKLAHPEWGMAPPSFDVTNALMVAIADFDLIRARLLTEIVYRQGKLLSFEPLRADVQTRITYDLGGRYEKLYKWLTAYQNGEHVHLDFFFSRLFGEVLSQPRFGFHQAYNAANVAANLIDSARNFRWTVSRLDAGLDYGQEYVRMVDAGVIADLYVRDWELHSEDAVLLAPAYTYLMSNRPVDYQFWLNIGSGSWAQRLYQPLTHPYVLSLDWPEGKLWTDDDEVKATQDSLYRLATGLVRRCRQRIYLGYCQYGEQGYEQRGPMLELIQRMLKRQAQDGAHV